MMVFAQKLLSFLIVSAAVYDSYVSAQKRRLFGSQHCCERKCTGAKEVCFLIQVTATKDRWECVTMYDETDYPIRMENGEYWRPFWWYNATAGGWPSDETDTLGAQFGLCKPAAHYCFGRLPQKLTQNETDLLAVDSAGNVFRWAFGSDNTAAHAVWLAFHDHQQTGHPEGENIGEWEPIVVAGGPYRISQDSFMYRMEHGVLSFMLDDDNCDCRSTLNAGHGMCFEGFHRNYGTEDMYGVGLLNENGCGGPSDTNSLFLYYRVPSEEKK